MRRFTALLIVMLTLAGGAVAPAQAQRFGLFFGDERSDFRPERISCLNDHQIRQAIAEEGYHDIYLNVPMDKRVQVRASRGDWVYLLEFNYCSGEIESGKKLRRAR